MSIVYPEINIQPFVEFSENRVFHAIKDIGSHQFFILAFDGISAISHTIKWITKSHLSHVAMYLDGMCYESWHSCGVVVNTMDSLPHTHRTPFDIYAVNLSFDVCILKSSLEKYLGIGYDFKNVIRYAFNMSPSHTDNMFCSDYLARVMLDCGYDLWNDESKRISPDEAVISKPFFIKCGRGVFLDGKPSIWEVDL